MCDECGRLLEEITFFEKSNPAPNGNSNCLTTPQNMRGDECGVTSADGFQRRSHFLKTPDLIFIFAMKMLWFGKNVFKFFFF